MPPAVPAGLRLRQAVRKKDKALQSYEEAYQLDATYLPALEGLGHLLVQVKRFDDALKVYQTILIHHRDDLTDLEVVEIYWKIGDVYNAAQAVRSRAEPLREGAVDRPGARAVAARLDGRWPTRRASSTSPPSIART